MDQSNETPDAPASSRCYVADLAKVVEPLLQRGYHVMLSLEDDSACIECITGGDTNCTHPKYYDPADGHGYTSVHMDDIPDKVLDSFDDRMPEGELSRAWAAWMVAEAERLEAKPKSR